MACRERRGGRLDRRRLVSAEGGETIDATVIVLTRNEAQHIGACLAALAREPGDFEVLVVDSASADGTLGVARAVADARVRILASERDLTVGEARNLGVAAAKGRRVLFVSADTEPAPGWFAAAARALDGADVVYGRQEHAPLRLSVASVSRGLRYHLFDREPPLDPIAYASNANAGYRREVLERFPFPEDRARSALDDVLLGKAAAAAGFRLVYASDMAVLHRDVDTLAGERTKVRREGLGWGALAREVGWNRPVLLWAGLLGVSLLAAAVLPGPLTFAVLLGGLYAPGARRLLARRRRYPVRETLGAVALAPLLDLEFLAAYARGLLRGESA